MDPEARTPPENTPAPEAEQVIEIPNDDTFIIEEGVTVSSPETPEPDVKPADDAEPESLLDAVSKSIETPSDPDPKKTEDGSSADDKEDQNAIDLSAEPTDAELENYSKKAQSRIRNLIDQRNAAAEAARQVEPILDFLEKNDIPGQDLDVVLDLTARLRHGDFAGFLQGVQPYVNLAMQHTGQILPPDLKQQVDKGYVSPQIARELAQTRAQQQFGQHNAARNQQNTQQALVQERATNIRTAITNWETQARANDPDYGLKADVVRRTAQAYMQERGVPQTADQAIAFVNEAYAEVNKQMQNFRPAPKPTLDNPSSTASKGGTVPQSEPGSMMEAALQGLQASRG